MPASSRTLAGAFHPHLHKPWPPVRSEPTSLPCILQEDGGNTLAPPHPLHPTRQTRTIPSCLDFLQARSYVFRTRSDTPPVAHSVTLNTADESRAALGHWPDSDTDESLSGGRNGGTISASDARYPRLRDVRYIAVRRCDERSSAARRRSACSGSGLASLLGGARGWLPSALISLC